MSMFVRDSRGTDHRLDPALHLDDVEEANFCVVSTFFTSPCARHKNSLQVNRCLGAFLLISFVVAIICALPLVSNFPLRTRCI